MKSLYLAGALALAIGNSAAADPVDCNENVLSIGKDQFAVAIADTEDKRSRGLMGFDHMPLWAGMLFVFPETAEVSFWMKNTLIPLDMIFITEDGTIAKIHDRAIPHDRTSIHSDAPIRYVLEINGGVSEALDFEAGDLVVSPVIGTGCAAFEDPAEG